MVRDNFLQGPPHSMIREGGDSVDQRYFATTLHMLITFDQMNADMQYVGSSYFGTQLWLLSTVANNYILIFQTGILNPQ